MKLFLITFLMLFLVSGCKQSDVQFSNAPSTPVAPPGNQGNAAEPVEPAEPIVNEPELPTPQPPVVKILKEPVDHLFGDQTSVQYEVVPGDGEITKVSCFVNQQEVDCDLNSSTLELSGFDMGNYRVDIKAIDENQLQGENHANWAIVDRYIDKNQSVNVIIEKKLTDVLFVIDNSGSMQVEQAEVARRIGNFFGQIKRVDWRVGIITTDPYEFDPVTKQENILADGALLAYPNGNYFIDNSLTIDQAGNLFAKTIFRPETGNGHERGIYNTYRAIERSLSPLDNSKNWRLADFFRRSASLSVILISDENETLVNGVGNPLWDLPKSNPRNLVELVEKSWGAKKQFQFNSIIVRPGDDTCIGPDESFGHAYDELSQLTGGAVEDICASNYSSALKSIGEGVADLQKEYKLECEAADVDQNGQGDLSVRPLDGQGLPSYVVNGDRVVFDEPLSEGAYFFDYKCLNSVPE